MDDLRDRIETALSAVREKWRKASLTGAIPKGAEADAVMEIVGPELDAKLRRKAIGRAYVELRGFAERETARADAAEAKANQVTDDAAWHLNRQVKARLELEQAHARVRALLDPATAPETFTALLSGEHVPMVRVEAVRAALDQPTEGAPDGR